MLLAFLLELASKRICVSPQAFVVVGDHNGHVGLGVKCAKEVRCLPHWVSCPAVAMQMFGDV